MKPLYLKMKAFESYLQETEIDFSKLEDSGVFLIWGNTGAGKTTIFDAITYALYGELSQQQKNDAKAVRTLDAPVSDVTSVSFTFEEKNRRYCVTRVLKAKPSYPSETTSDAVLEYLDDTSRPSIRGMRAVTTEVETIVGLTSEQFFQTTLIAQGSFAKILVAKTDERAKIFRMLFNTYFYQDFVDRIKNSKLEMDNQAKTLDGKLNTIYQSITFYAPEDEEQKSAVVAGEQRIAFLKACEEKYQKLYEAKKDDKEKIDASLQQLAVEEENAKHFLNDQKQLRSLISSQEQNQITLKEKKQNVLELEDKKGEVEQFHDEATLLQSKLPQYQELSEADREREGLLKTIQISKKNSTSLQQQNKTLEDSISSIAETIQQLQGELENESDHATELANKENEYKTFLSYEEKATSLKRLAIELKQLDPQVLQTKAEYQQAHDEFIAIDSKYYESMSGIIAKEKLKEGQPCPVCGSLEHPHVHTFTKDDVSKEMYDAAKKKEEEKKNSHHEVMLNYETKAGNYTMLKDELVSDLKPYGVEEEKLLDRIGFSEKLCYILKQQETLSEKEISSLRTKKEDYLKKRKDLESLLKELEADKMKKEALGQRLLEVEKEKISKERDLENLEKNRKAVASTLTYSSEEEAKKRIRYLQEEEEKYERLLQQSRDSYEEALKKEQKYQGQVKELQNRVDSYQGQAFDAIEEQLRVQKDKSLTIDNEIKKLFNSIESINKNCKLYSDINKEYDKATKKYDLYNTLQFVFSGTSNASLQDKYAIDKGVSLETYVLEYYFDQVLQRASVRLFKMSDGRYRLLRRDALKSKVGQIGLDIDVFDCITNQQRNVGSLSGGETFIASLSLALGLSDYVREVAGGIHIETLFIDEGFGNLDRDSLDEVIDTISTLAIEGNVTIGIISHVEDLSSRFSSRITVDKDRLGHSQCTVEIS